MASRDGSGKLAPPEAVRMVFRTASGSLGGGDFKAIVDAGKPGERVGVAGIDAGAVPPCFPSTSIP